MASRWEPMPDGDYLRDSIIDGRIVMRVDEGGDNITIIGPEDMWESISLSPFKFRLCRQVDSPPMVEMTERRIETLRNVLNLCRIAMWNEAASELRAMLTAAKGDSDE